MEKRGVIHFLTNGYVSSPVYSCTTIVVVLPTLARRAALLKFYAQPRFHRKHECTIYVTRIHQRYDPASKRGSLLQMYHEM